MLVTIYNITRYQAYMADECGSGYTLTPWGKDTLYYKGDDDGGRQYHLPDGYEVTNTDFGDPAIYDKDGKYCTLITTKDDCPAIVDKDGNTIRLVRANA